MDIKSLLKDKKFTQNEETKIEEFQDYAINVCKDFGITGIYRSIIFRHAKRNMPYLQGKVAFCKEKFGENGCSNAGRYLISLFRKKPPWQK